MTKIVKLSLLSAVTVSSMYGLDTGVGKLSGDLSVYGKSQKYTDTTRADEGYSLGSVSAKFVSEDVEGFKATISGITNVKLSEKNDADYDETKKVLLTELNLEYKNNLVTVIAGRQAVDLEWIRDYHTGVVAIANIDKLQVIGGWTKAWTADAYNDGSLANFQTIKDASSGSASSAYVLDATYSLNDMIKVNGYYMNASGLFSALGGKVEADVNNLTVVGKYAQSNEELSSNTDAKIYAFDGKYKIDKFTINGGYINVGEDGSGNLGGVASLDTLGDTINPLDSGEDAVGHKVVYGFEAKTAYIGASADLYGFEIKGIYGTTKYNLGTDITQNEINLSLSKNIVENLKANLLYVDISNDGFPNDYSYVTGQLVYSF
ncbi:MAG: Opr family porin [Arcobacteraceae bacterium]|nr:Opr family porin [Arcobacteraceae bacterium]